MLFSLQKETGWTREYVLWGESWLALQLKIADMPRMMRRPETAKEIEDDAELRDFLLGE